MRFGILGPLEVWDGDRQLAIGGPQQRTLLAVLLLRANQVVSTERLVDHLWGQHPPATARGLLQGLVAGLRRTLRAHAEPDWRPLQTRAPGYLLLVRPGELDAERVEDLVARAAAVAETEAGLARASELLAEALSLWRGPVLENVTLGAGRGETTRWEERRLAVLEERIELDLRLGRHARLIGELQGHVRDQPLREGLWRQLMLALVRAGRQADALAAYGRLRQLLVEQLGIEPGASVQQLHRTIVSGEPTAAPAGPRVVPAQLPAAIAGFVGRTADLKLLDELLTGAARMPIGVISGMAGVGKTALAVDWAHRNRERFQDGQLYVDLRGYDPVRPPMAPAEAIRGFLDALQVPTERLPAGLDAQAGLYRSLLADRRMLVLLDNARDAAQIRQLLPGTDSCLVVVTSRNQLSSLIAGEGARPLALDLLSRAEARQLLVRRIGAERPAAEPEATEEIIARCARLPLALAVVAARAATRPQHPLRALADELRGARTSLDAWSDPDPSIDIRAALDVSYRTLSTEAARLFRLLSLHPGPHIDGYAAAALLDTTLPHAGRLLDQLFEANLLQEPAAGRYVFHDLIRTHATHTAATTEARTDRRAALARLLDHYRHTTSVAMDAAHPYERERRPVVPPAHTPAPDLPAPAAATGWLDAELANLLAVAGFAAEHGWPEHAWHLSVHLHLHLRTRSRFSEAEALDHLVLAAARAGGHRAGELDALLCLGGIHRLQGRHEQALDEFGEALTIARSAGLPTGELAALNGLGYVHALQDRYDQAADHHTEALAIARTTGNRAGELEALRGLAYTHVLRDRYDQAADHHAQALAIARTTGDRAGELDALRGLGWIHQRQGRYEQATVHYRQALAIARAAGIRTGELHVLAGLGWIHRVQGRYEPAAEHCRQVLAIAREIGDRNGQFEALQDLGRLHHATGDPAASLAHHREALALATELAQPADQARAHDGLAHAHRALDRPERAREHWGLALDILTSLGTEHTEEPEVGVDAIRAHLAALDQP
jgi:DNA-binding SARP family transcriptional activator/tetratricopeptide (TPR) repeat protein